MSHRPDISFNLNSLFHSTAKPSPDYSDWPRVNRSDGQRNPHRWSNSTPTLISHWGAKSPFYQPKKKKITWDQKKTDKERNKSNKCERATSYCKTMELQNTVKEALNALYHHPDDGVRLQADRWLQDFQRTLDAWQVLCASLCVLVDLNVLFSFPEFLIDCWSFGEFGSRFGFGFLFSLRCDFSDYFGMFDHRDAIGFVSSLESLVHFIWMRWIQF